MACSSFLPPCSPSKKPTRVSPCGRPRGGVGWLLASGVGHIVALGLRRSGRLLPLELGYGRPRGKVEWLLCLYDEMVSTSEQVRRAGPGPATHRSRPYEDTVRLRSPSGWG